jgi:hypothetical protein
MKNLTMILLLLFAGNLFSQENLFKKIKEQVKKEHPEMNVENKLLVINVWSVKDAKSREANSQINKAYTIYEYAKLKGGVKGMIGVLFCTDNDLSTETIILNKDKTTKPIVLNDNAGINLQGISNMIFDSTGNVVAKNITVDIFEEVHQLITR